MDALQGWREYVQRHEHSLLRDLLAEDTVFESPILHTPQTGREIVRKYLEAAVDVIGNQNFRYVGEWRNDNGVVLEFATEIEGIKINGVDIIGFTEDCAKIARIKVMIRPLKAIQLVHRRMGERLLQASQIE